MTRLNRCLLLLAFLCAGFIGVPSAHAALAPAPKAAPAADKLDLNTASFDQLKVLKGIGDVYAKRIISGRPYTAKNQLVTRGIVPQATYNGIKDQIVAHPVKKK